jgi:glycosyltransferase involved in cell wall biosynthesis
MNSTSSRPLRVLHIITRLIVGGAQENTMLSCALMDPHRFVSEVLSGPETGAEGELHSECARRGVRVVIEPGLVRRVAPHLDLAVLGRLVGFIRNGRYDIVHTHSSKAGILGRIAARLARTRVIIHTVHGWGFHRRQAAHEFGGYVALERWCARLCDALVVVGEADRAEGLALGIGRSAQYRLIRSGIEIEAYRDVNITRDEARRRIGVPLDAFVVGSVARLSEQKAPLDLIAAFEPLAAAIPDAHLVIVGDGPLRAQVERRLSERGLTGRVHLMGLRGDVPELLRAFDVFALASRWEGLPRVFPQAMAAGLPIVATRVAGAVDAVVPGVSGVLVEPGDMAAFSAGLLQLANDRPGADRMGARGAERVAEFSAGRMVEQLAALYSDLAAAKS